MLHEVIPFDADDPIIESLLDEVDTGVAIIEQDLDNLCFATEALLYRVKAATLG